MKSRAASCVALVALLATAACSSDSSGPDRSNQLTHAEAIALVSAYFDVVWGPEAQSAIAAAAPNLSLVPDTTIHTSDGMLPCPRGGNVLYASVDTVIVDNEAESMLIRAGGTHTPAQFVLRAGATDFTVNGSPNLVFRSTSGFLGTEPLPVQESLAGVFAWSAGQRSGACTVDYQRTVNQQTGQQTLQGSICGYPLGAF